MRKREKSEIERGVPEGDFMISSSIVRQDPPALVILARAPSVKRRAATSSLGRSKILMSSVTVPTTTAVRPVLSPICLTILLRDTGGLIVLEATSLLRMVLQKLDSVLLERNLKSCAQKKERWVSKGKRIAIFATFVRVGVVLGRYLLSLASVDKDSCFSCLSCSSSKFCLFYTSRCPRRKREVNNCLTKPRTQLESVLFQVTSRQQTKPTILPCCLYLY